MAPFLRRTTLSLCMGLAVAGLGAALVAPDDAHAQDDDKRRVLKARQMEDVDMASEYAKAAEAKRLESIEFLKELLAKGDAQGDRKAEMMLRLADMYFQQGRTIYLREMAEFDKEYDKCFNTEGCSTESMKADNSESADWQQKSIRLYQQILRNYPRYARADEATFYLAMALQDTGNREEAVKQFTNLVKSYPDSGFVPDAYVNIGEYYFDNNNAYKALLAYKKATADREHEKYSFALYKLAWCYYNVGEYGKGIDTMKSVVAFTQTQSEAKNRLQLQEEALKDLVRFFADAGEMDEAYEYFNKLGKKDLIRSMLMRLANMYFEQGKFEQSIQTYRRLISENPQSPDNPGYQVEIIKAYKKIGKKQDTLQEIDRLLKTYGKNSAWARANASNQDAVKSASDEIEKNLRQVAVEYHTEAKKLGTGDSAKEAYALAYKAYKVYLDEYPDSSHAYEVRYAFGELLYKIKKFDEAYEQYMKVVEIDPNGKHSRFCAESSIFAADEMIKREGSGSGASKPGPGGSKEPQELTQWEQNLVKACNQYAKLYPDDKKVRNIIYKSAYLLYNKFRFEEAAEQFKVVIQMDPKSKEAEQAANLILDSFVVNEDWENLKKNAKFYYDQEGLGSAKFKTEVYGVYQRASFKLIEANFTKNQDKKAAADGYMAFYEEFKTTAELEVLAKALNNSTVYYRDVGAKDDEMKVRHLLVEDEQFGPKTKYYYEQIAALGFNYENVADFDRAAFYYEKMFSLYPEHRKKTEKEAADQVGGVDSAAADGVYSAAVFRKAMDDWQAAINDYQQFITTFPTDERVNDVKLTIGKIYEEQSMWDKAADVFFKFYRETKDVPPELYYFARLHHADALGKQGQTKKQLDLYKEIVAEHDAYVKKGGKPGAHTEFVAGMMFTLAQPTFDKFAKLEIKSLGKGNSQKREDSHMKAQVKELQDGIKEVEETYAGIIKTGSGEWGLAALTVLGKAQERLAEALLTGDAPFYLTDDQVELYRMSMQDIAYPRQDKAAEFYKAALDKAYELTLYNENTAYATRRLGELRPNDFPGLEESVLKPGWTSSKLRTYDFEHEL